MSAVVGCEFPRCVTQQQCRDICLAPVWERLDTCCSVCERRFDRDEWDNRHSAEDGSDVHEGCCEQCRKVA